MTKQLMLVCEAKLSLEAQQDGSGPSGAIEAKVTTWGAREGADGRRFFYKPEGFMEWAKAFEASGRPLPMFYNHNSEAVPCGEWTNFSFENDGLSATGRLFLNTTQGQDLYAVMKESPAMLGGVSIGAYAEQFQWVKEDGEIFPAGSDEYWDEGYFQITKGGLSEVSVVMYPNNPAAEVQRLEFFRADGTADLKILEKALRDAGLTKKDAVTSASIFKRVIEQREAGQLPAEAAATQSDSDVEVTKEAELLAALEARELLKRLDQKIKG